MTLQLSGTTGASLVQDSVITQADLAANVAGTGPLFMAYQSTLQALPATTFTKLSFQAEEYDTHSAFSAGTMVTSGDSTNRFTPQVAGFYQVNALWSPAAGVQAVSGLYKNGVSYKAGTNVLTPNAATSSVSALVYLDGTTDYIDFRGYSNSIVNTSPGIASTYFQAYLVRAA